MKNKILIKVIIDSREKNIDWIKKFKFDKKFSSEKIKIENYEIKKPFKCSDSKGNTIKTSTGDVGIMYSIDDGKTWCNTNLSIELKKGSDFTTTLYSNWSRFTKEIKRAIDYNLDFYIVYNQSTRQMHEHFEKLKSFKRISFHSQHHKIIYDRMLELADDNITLFYTHEIHEVVKRIIKHHIKKIRKIIDK